MNSHTEKLSQFVDSENCDRTLMLKGLWYRTSKSDLICHLESHGNITEKDVCMEQFMGRKSGIAAVTFKTPELAKEAYEKFKEKPIYGY